MKDFISTCKQIIPFLLILGIGHFSKKEEWTLRRTANSLNAGSEEAQEGILPLPIPPGFGFIATAQAEAVNHFTPPPVTTPQVLELLPQHTAWPDSLHQTAMPYLRGNLLVDQKRYAGAANEGAKGKPVKNTKQPDNESRRDKVTQQGHSGSVRFNIPNVAR